MGVFLNRKILFLFFLAFSWCLSAKAQDHIGPKQDLFKVDEVRVEGLRKVEREAVMEKIKIRPDMILDNYLLKKDIEKIYSLRYFDSVEAHHEVEEGKNILIFRMQERPIIEKISIEGNEDISDDDLKEQIKSKEFSIVDINGIKADIAALQKHYEEKGYYLASVDYKLKPAGPEQVELVFNIQEFDKVKVKKITFLGNKDVSDQDLLPMMETKEESLLSPLSGSGNFKETNFQTDIERIKYLYKTRGYLQVNVDGPEITISEDKKWVFVTIRVQEGPKFAVNKIYFEGDLIFPEDTLREKVQLKEDETYSEDKLRLDIQKLTEIYQDEGYAFANVLRTLDVVPGENKVDVRFSFEKGKIAYFGKISVVGNIKTRDKVIRRELKIREGMKFNGTALRESKENVNRLGFFEKDSVLFNTTSPKDRDDILDVEISIKERNTGQISVGAGYSTATGLFVQASISQNNFRGMGQILSFSLSHSDTNQVFNLGFTEPYLNDSKWTAGGDIFRTKNKVSDSGSYKQEGFDGRVGYPLFEFTRLFLTYKFEDTLSDSFDDPGINLSVENGVASSLTTEVVHDKRNNKYEPTEGYWASFMLEYAGLGGAKTWVKNELEFRYYKPVWQDLILRARLYTRKLFQTGKTIPWSEKFMMGGARNMRGYDFEDIGPMVFTKDRSGNPRRFNRRGLFSLLGTLEFEHPLVREAGLKWVVFADAGNIYKTMIGEDGDYTVRSDYGFGFRWFAPIGVLRFEFGYPVARRAHEQSSQFFFDIGQLF